MGRANTFEVVTQSKEDAELLCRLLDASAALWNETNYERCENYADPDGDYETLVSIAVVTAEHLALQRFSRSNVRILKRGSRFCPQEEGKANGTPGYWGNADDGNEKHTDPQVASVGR